MSKGRFMTNRSSGPLIFLPTLAPRGRRLSGYSRFPHRRDLDRNRLSRVYPLDSAQNCSESPKAMIIFASGDLELLSGSRATSLRVEESRGNANAKCRERECVRVLLMRPYLRVLFTDTNELTQEGSPLNG